jgi:hypothetical protein
MPCVHLQQLFQLCQDHEIKLASSDLIHLVCTQCDEKEVCPSVLTDEYDAIQLKNGPSRLEAEQAKK